MWFNRESNQLGYEELYYSFPNIFDKLYVVLLLLYNMHITHQPLVTIWCCMGPFIVKRGLPNLNNTFILSRFLKFQIIASLVVTGIFFLYHKCKHVCLPSFSAYLSPRCLSTLICLLIEEVWKEIGAFLASVATLEYRIAGHRLEKEKPRAEWETMPVIQGWAC